MVTPAQERELARLKADASIVKTIEDEGNSTQNKEGFDRVPLNCFTNQKIQLHGYPSVFSRRTPRNLLDMCLGVLGEHLEDIVEHLADISVLLPRNVKLALIAIARRRKLLDDGFLVALLDDSFVILDVSGSDVSDFGLSKVVHTCPNLHAVDIRNCRRITVKGVSALVSQCHSIEILRWGGCPTSEDTARKSLSMLVPRLNAVEEESWENLDDDHLVDGAQSLRWLVWPNINQDTKARLAAECPRIVVNPQPPSPLSSLRFQVPPGAYADKTLDEPYIIGIDPRTWSTPASSMHAGDGARFMINGDHKSPPEAELRKLSVAEKFRLAFAERDQRLAPKRAKNLRQHQRRAEKEWVSSSKEGKSIVLASKFRASLKR